MCTVLTNKLVRWERCPNIVAVGNVDGAACVLRHVVLHHISNLGQLLSASRLCCYYCMLFSLPTRKLKTLDADQVRIRQHPLKFHLERVALDDGSWATALRGPNADCACASCLGNQCRTSSGCGSTGALNCSCQHLTGGSPPPKPALLLSTKVLDVKKDRSFFARLSLLQKSWKIAPPNAPLTVTWLPLKVDCAIETTRLIKCL